MLSSSETWETGTSHQLSLLGTGASSSDSMWIATVCGMVLTRSRASRNSSMPLTRITSAPRLSAFAARSIGSLSPFSRCDSLLR